MEFENQSILQFYTSVIELPIRGDDFNICTVLYDETRFPKTWLVIGLFQLTLKLNVILGPSTKVTYLLLCSFYPSFVMLIAFTWLFSLEFYFTFCHERHIKHGLSSLLKVIRCQINRSYILDAHPHFL